MVVNDKDGKTMTDEAAEPAACGGSVSRRPAYSTPSFTGLPARARPTPPHSARSRFATDGVIRSGQAARTLCAACPRGADRIRHLHAEL